MLNNMLINEKRQSYIRFENLSNVPKKEFPILEETMKAISQKLSQKATEALLYEVSASPKPGLVDRFNSGAHRDMDFFTFMSSSSSLTQYFYKCSYQTMSYLNANGHLNAISNETGLTKDITDNTNRFYSQLFNQLRVLGIEAEEIMFKTTKGINTHKGLVFSLGLMVSGTILAGYWLDQSHISVEVICLEIQQLVRKLCQLDFASIKYKTKLSAGEKLYLDYGIKGIRGEAEDGYKNVREIGLPVLKKAMSQGASMNDAMVHTLLHLMSETMDTNILNRQDWDELIYVQECAKKILDHGGALKQEGLDLVHDLDKEFMCKNISPGGSADLLAVTVYLFLLQQ